ncbi:MAG: hypothetical protein KJ970_09780 [Candidatus Eisenbacteria bacterium]|uniref:TolC family protein n=1 Tax=Eiseniibacteriota bacterium TaxID=2212470 RepID=A0A948W3K8_UNCEI|nr:hypothetical protein [Candidatus Eisenbacteria bacterium]MBU1947173.1 hypothetical protein [Candidatus Eisenbacteria bacterium]MBU2691207.1 hypothetical protein [Candidatus Eisenbacteria bacterium]
MTLRFLMVSMAISALLAGFSHLHAQNAVHPASLERPEMSLAMSDLSVPETLQGDPEIRQAWSIWVLEKSQWDSLVIERNQLEISAHNLDLRLAELEIDPASNEPKNRVAHAGILADGELIREEVDRIDVELVVSRNHLRETSLRILERIDAAIGDRKETIPRNVHDFRENLLVWQGMSPLIPTIEVEIGPEDTPDDLRDKAAYLRDLADGLDHLAGVLERRLESLRREERLLRGAEELWDEADFLDDGGSWQSQGEAPLRFRIEGAHSPINAKPGSVLFYTPDGAWNLDDLLEERPTTEGEMRRVLGILSSAQEEVAFQSDSARAQAERLEEEAVELETP